MSLEERFDACMRQHELMFGESLIPLNKRCSKCQGLGHTPSVCPNKEVVTLADWEAAMEVELEEEKEEVHEAYEDEGQEVDFDLPPKFDEYEPDKGEVLVITSTWNELQKEVVEADEGEELTFAIPKTLNPNFCQSISEPLLKAPNLALRVFEEVVRSISTQSPLSTIRISKGIEKKRVSRIKRDLFAWLLLFQPDLKQEEEFFT